MHSQNPMYVASFQWSAKYIQVPWSIVFATVKQQRRSVPVMCNFTGNTSLLLWPKHPYSLLSFFTLSPIQSVLGAVSKTQLCEEFAVMGLSSDCWGWIHCKIHNYFLCLASSSSNPGPKLWIFFGDKSVISLGKCDELLQFLILSAMKRMSTFECGSRFHNLPLELSK